MCTSITTMSEISEVHVAGFTLWGYGTAVALMAALRPWICLGRHPKQHTWCSMDVSSSLYRWFASSIVLIIVKSAFDKISSIRSAFASIKGYPGRVVIWLKPLGSASLALGLRFPRPGMYGYWGAKFSLYKKLGTTSYASVLLSEAQPHFWLADAEAIRLVASDTHTFQKDVIDYEIINIYGGNLVSKEGSEWKRHRSVAKSAFNETNVALAWSESLRVMDEWFEQLDASGPDIAVDLLSSLTQATLLVIVAAGFGKRIFWTDDLMAELPPGCKLTFQSAVLNSMKSIIPRALIPEWLYPILSLINVPYLSSCAMMTRLAFDDLRIHMLDLVASARNDIATGKHSGDSGSTLLWNIVKANMDQEEHSMGLTEGEVLSNIFAFLLAGHETSSHSLCFMFMLLALHPDCQQKVFEEVTRVWPEDQAVAQFAKDHNEHMEKLEYTVACIRETLRVFPVEARLVKLAHADTVLPSTSFAVGPGGTIVETGKFTLAVPAGSSIVSDVWAVHMNPLHWGQDAAEFKPERFIDTESYKWPRHAYLPFSLGARSCIGQRFAFAEMIAILASVVRRYRILVPDELANKPLEVQEEIMLKWKTGVALTPLNAHVKFCRRV